MFGHCLPNVVRKSDVVCAGRFRDDVSLSELSIISQHKYREPHAARHETLPERLMRRYATIYRYFVKALNGLAASVGTA